MPMSDNEASPLLHGRVSQIEQPPTVATVQSATPTLNLFQRCWHRTFPHGFQPEFVKMLLLAWPSILTTLLQFMLQTTSFIICGHLSKEDLDGVALGNSIINVAGLSIGMGMSTACDTLFSQTYGSRNRKLMGLYLQRSLLLMNLALLPLACLHLNIRPLLLLMGQAPEIAQRAAMYIRLFLPGLMFQFNYLVLSRYLQNQSRMNPPMVAALIANVFNAAAQYVAIHVLGFSYLASSVIQGASLGLMFLITLAYILFTKVYRETWGGWRLNSLYDWGDFVKLSVPGIFLIGLEEWGFEIATIIAGILGAVQLGAQSIIFQLESISYMIPFGMSVAVNIRVGQQLGANQPVGAAQSFRVGLVMTIGIAVVMCNLFIFLRNYLPRVFTSQSDIVSTASQVIPWLGLFQLFDGISAVSCGAIRGTGRQVEGAVLLFIGYYVIGLPIGIPLALLTDLQVTGTWLGLLAGIALEAVAFCVLVLRFNWRKEAEKAQVRAYGRHWRRRLWQERRRRRMLGLKSDTDEDETTENGEADAKNGDGDDIDDEANGDGDSPFVSEAESEFAPLLGASGAFYGGFDSAGYGALANDSADGAAARTSATADADATGAAGAGAASDLIIDIPRPNPEDLAFYSDPEMFYDTGGLIGSTATATATATPTAATAATSQLAVADSSPPPADGTATVTATATPTAEASPLPPALLSPPPVATDPRRRRGGQPGWRHGLYLGRRRKRDFWGLGGTGGGSLLYTGRFYGSSRMPLNDGVIDDDDDDDGAGGDSVGQDRLSLQSLLFRRLLLLAILGAAVAGAVVLMLFTDAWLDEQEAGTNQTTVAMVTTTAATLLKFRH